VIVKKDLKLDASSFFSSAVVSFTSPLNATGRRLTVALCFTSFTAAKELFPDLTRARILVSIANSRVG
jgi:hypothetical protein